MIVSQRNLLEKHNQILFLVCQLDFEGFCRCRRSCHFETKDSHSKCKMMVVWVLCKDSTEKCCLRKSSRSHQRDVMRDWIESSSLLSSRKSIGHFLHQVNRIDKHFLCEMNCQSTCFSRESMSMKSLCSSKEYLHFVFDLLDGDVERIVSIVLFLISRLRRSFDRSCCCNHRNILCNLLFLSYRFIYNFVRRRRCFFLFDFYSF